MSQSSEYEKRLEDLQKFVLEAHKIEDMANKILTSLSNTEYHVLDSFKPLIKPKINITKLLNFYTTYKESDDKFNKISIELEKQDIFSLKEDDNVDIKLLSKYKLIRKYESLEEINISLEKYSKVKIALQLINKVNETMNIIVSLIDKAFFKTLERLPVVIKGMEEYSKFLLRTADQKSFLVKYTKEVYEKLSFIDPKGDLNSFVNQTKDLTYYFNLVINLNCKTLGRKIACNINIELIKLITLGLKQRIGAILTMVDQNNKPEYIAGLIKLFGNLRHKGEPIIRELEEIFVFKDQILKLISNCFIQMFGEIDLIMYCNEYYNKEYFVINMLEILDSFAEEKGCKDEWVNGQGPMFGIFEKKELGPSMSEKCLIKINKLSDLIQGIQKHVYLINNLYAFRKHTSTFLTKDLNTSINASIKLIIGLWKLDLEKYKKENFSKKIKRQLKEHIYYVLPDPQREEIKIRLKEAIEDLISTGFTIQDLNEIVELIEKVYSGNKESS